MNGIAGYTGEVLSDALVYSDHGHRGAHPSMNAQSNAGQGTNSLSMADVRLAIQAKTEQGINTPWPKDASPSSTLSIFLSLC